MKTIATLKTACLLALTLTLTSSLAASKKDVDEAMSRDGLQKINVKGLDLAYARPGASLAAYKRVKLDPVEVQFDKSWDPTKTGSRIKLGPEEREKIRASVAKLVEEEFAKTLQKGGTYQIASESAPDVLRVKVSVLNVYINAPSRHRRRPLENLCVIGRPDDAAGRALRLHQRPDAGARRRPPRRQQHGAHGARRPHRERGRGAGRGGRLGADPAQGARQGARDRIVTAYSVSLRIVSSTSAPDSFLRK